MNVGFVRFPQAVAWARFGLCAFMIALAACGQDETAAKKEDQTGGPQAYGNIDRDRLLAADKEPGNWFTTGRDFGKGHFSPLEQINRETVGRLGFAWEYETFTTRGLEATPIVVDGVMYSSGSTGRAYALDAATGEEIWYFDPKNDGQVNRYACCDEVNRGVAVWDGMVYVASLDGRLFGLDAESGDVVWETDTIITEKRGYTITGAPEVAGDVVVIGNGGADYDARGYISAYDLKTGELAWQFFTVPGDPEKGFEHPELEMAAETWDPDSRWDVGGGGTVWDAMVYDPELNLLYVGTGNAALFNWHERSPAGGDNLFLASILAIDPDTGRLVWHHQQVPRESWDYTSTQPMILTDFEFEGEVRKVLMHAPKNGFFYIYDRRDGELLFAEKFVPVNWATGVDLGTGRPNIDTEAVDYDEEPKFVVPSGMGGHNWNPMAYSPETGLIYIPAIEGGSLTWDPTEGHEYRPKLPNAGHMILFGDSLHTDPAQLPDPVRSMLRELQDSGQAQSYAALKAFDPRTGDVVWEQRTQDWWDHAGVLATARGLVFQGNDRGYFRAYDAETGELLKEIEIGTSIIAAPTSYSVNGEQYIAVMAAWGGGGWFAPHETSAAVKYGNKGRIVAFKLDGGEVPVPQPLGEPDPIPEPPQQDVSPETIERGAELFNRNCRLCHANVAHGMTPDLRRMSRETHAEFKAIVLEGARRYNSMPQWDDVLSEEDAEAIHAYLIAESWRAYKSEKPGKTEDAQGAGTRSH